MHKAVNPKTSGRDRAGLSRKRKLDDRSSRALHVIRRTVALCIALVALVVAPATAFAAPTVGGCAVFPANNYWNTPVDTLPLHPSSTTWVNSIGATAGLHADWGNVLADNYGIPFVTVPGTQPTVPIVFDPDGYADESDPGPMPIPPNAPIEGGPSSSGDRHVLVIEATDCILYELYVATPLSGGSSWSVYSSAKFDLKSNALRPDSYTSADAAGLPIFPGLVRWEEVAAGEIAHAIRFTASSIWGTDAATGLHKYLWPARHWSGSSTDSTLPPMGARFRLKASFDISTFDASTQVILRAFKKYGLVLADAGSNWFFQGVSDTNWPDIVFSQLGSIAGSNFEVVDTALLMVDPNSAEAAQSSGAPTLQSVVSSRAHGAAGTFNLTLSPVTTNPTTEPRLGPAQTLVFTFNKTLTAGTATLTEGTATVGVPTFNGSEMIVPLTGVTNQQYVTVTLTNVASSDGGTGGVGTGRIALLVGDVNNSRSVTATDILQVKGRSGQATDATNFKFDLNASGSITASDILAVKGRSGLVLP